MEYKQEPDVSYWDDEENKNRFLDQYPGDESLDKNEMPMFCTWTRCPYCYTKHDVAEYKEADADDYHFDCEMCGIIFDTIKNNEFNLDISENYIDLRSIICTK